MDESIPIDIDSNGEEGTAEVDSSTRAVRSKGPRSGSYKPSIDGKPSKRHRKLTSTVWEHYEFIEPDVDGNLYCKCKKCGKVYSGDRKYGTGNLKRHLSHCKKKYVRDIGQMLLQSNSGSLGNKRPDFIPEDFRDLLALCVVKHDLPFQFAEYNGVRHLFAYLKHDIKLFSRKTTECDVMKLFEKEKEKLKGLLESLSGKVSFTSDCWTSLNTDGFISLTAHYIDSNWCLHKKILNFSYLSPPHNGVALAEKILLMMKDWGVDKKVMSLTLDNASCNDFCVNMLKGQLRLVCGGQYFHVRCGAHIFNLIVKEGLKNVDDSVSKVRDCVKYCKGSQARKQRFLEACSICDVAYTRGLRQDVPTRWNSTFLMLESALYYKKVFTHLEVVDSSFVHYPRFDEWHKIEKICTFLKVFYEVTCTFSTSKYHTANLYFPNVVRVRLVLKKEMDSEDIFMREMVSTMFVKFEKYWSQVSTIMAIAGILDPRYKFQFVEWAFKKIYGGTCKTEVDCLKGKLFSLYDEYVKASNAPSKLAETSQTTCNRSDSQHSVFNSYFQDFDDFSQNEYVTAAKSELELYLDEPKLPRTDSYDVLGYWKSNQFRLPILSQMARDILTIPLSTVASESAFSVGGRVLDAYRSSLKPDTVEAIICLRDWVFDQAPMPGPTSDAFEDICADVMKMNLSGDGDENLSKSARSGVGQQSASIVEESR